MEDQPDMDPFDRTECGETRMWTGVMLTCHLPKQDHPNDFHYDKKVGCGTRWPTKEYLTKDKPVPGREETLTFDRYL